MICRVFPVEHFSCTDSRCVALHIAIDFSVTRFEQMRVQGVFSGSDHKGEQGNDCNQANRFAF